MALGGTGSQSVSQISIYMEGGGRGRDTKAALRVGMDGFLQKLKDAARNKSWRWKLVCCGSRTQAFRAYRNAQISSDASIVILLVDSEGPVQNRVHVHLNQRDSLNLTEDEEGHIHMMVQTMETWIVADAGALARYYQKGFNSNALPRNRDLESVPKTEIARSLQRATERTTKGEYHKIRHASDLLQLVDAKVVQKRCSYCKRLFDLLEKEVA